MSKGKLILLGLAGVAAAATFIFKALQSPVPREKVVNILQALNRDSYQIMYQISEMAREMINDKKLLPIQVKDLMQDPSNPVIRVFKDIENKTYEKFDVKEDDFTYAVERVYSKDVQINYLRNLFSQTYNKSILGVTPAVFIKSPLFLSQQKILQLTKKVLDQQLRVSKQVLKSTEQMISLQHFRHQTTKQVLDFKKQIAKQQKLTDLPDSPIDIIEFAVKQYLSKQQFNKKYQVLCKNYEQRMEQIIRSNTNKFV